MSNVTRSGAGDAIDEKSDVYGGVVLAVLALAALVVSFIKPGPGSFFGVIMWPRLFSLLVLAAGAGMATGQLKVRNKQDFYGGIALIGLAVVAFLISIDLPGMRGFAFGPGTAPRLFAGTLATLGLIVALTGLFTDGPEGQRYTVKGTVVVLATVAVWCGLVWLLSKITPFYAQPIATGVIIAASFVSIGTLDNLGLRGPYMITLSIFSFAMFIRPLGLVTASFMSIVICSAATADMRWRETIVWAAVLTAFCSFLFPWGLNLPFQLWPRFWW